MRFSLMTGNAACLCTLLFGERLLHAYHRLSHSFVGECGQVFFYVILGRITDADGPISNVAVGTFYTQIVTDLHHSRHNIRWIRILRSSQSQGYQQDGNT
jgi:hypothetical protein